VFNNKVRHGLLLSAFCTQFISLWLSNEVCTSHAAKDFFFWGGGTKLDWHHFSQHIIRITIFFKKNDILTQKKTIRNPQFISA
jgi:hypothetical protein